MMSIIKKICHGRILKTAVVVFAAFAAGTTLVFPKINRIHPPQNTEQYAREAARVRLEVLGESLGLSEEQMLKIRKAQIKMFDSMKKQDENLQKKQRKFEAEKSKILDKEQILQENYQKEFENCLTPQQLERYREMKRQEEGIGNDVPTCAPGKRVCPEDSAGSIGPIIEGPPRPILY